MKLRKFLYFLKNNFSYILGNETFLKSFLYFRRDLSKIEKLKNSLWKNFLYFDKRNIQAPKKLIKLFYALNKIPLGEIGWLSNHYFFLAAEASRFLIQFLWLTGHHAAPGSPLSSHFLLLTRQHAMPEVTTLISYNLCDWRDTMQCQRSPLSFCIPTRT